jgi:hypothetical protein
MAGLVGTSVARSDKISSEFLRLPIWPDFWNISGYLKKSIRFQVQIFVHVTFLISIPVYED